MRKLIAILALAVFLFAIPTSPMAASDDFIETESLNTCPGGNGGIGGGTCTG